MPGNWPTLSEIKWHSRKQPLFLATAGVGDCDCSHRQLYHVAKIHAYYFLSVQKARRGVPFSRYARMAAEIGIRLQLLANQTQRQHASTLSIYSEIYSNFYRHCLLAVSLGWKTTMLWGEASLFPESAQTWICLGAERQVIDALWNGNAVAAWQRKQVARISLTQVTPRKNKLSGV